eukprot:Skav217270  [mRNA]  locus=scaffold120:40130:41254:+ [translate_table: standard]
MLTTQTMYIVGMMTLVASSGPRLPGDNQAKPIHLLPSSLSTSVLLYVWSLERKSASHWATTAASCVHEE